MASPPAGVAHATPGGSPWQLPAPPSADERRAEAASTSAAWHATSLALPQSSFESVDLSNGSRPGDAGAGDHGSAAQPSGAVPAVLLKQGGHHLHSGAQQEALAYLSAPPPKQEASAGYEGTYERPQAALAEASHASYPLQGISQQLDIQQAQAGHEWPPSEAGSDTADRQEQGAHQVLKGWGVSGWARGKVWQSEHLQRALRGAAAAASKAGAALAPPPGPLSASSAASTPGSHRSAAQQPLAEPSAAVGSGLRAFREVHPEAHREVHPEPGSATAGMAESISSSGSLAAPGRAGLVSSWLDRPAPWGTDHGSIATAAGAPEGPGEPPVAGSRAGAGSMAGMFDRFRLGWAQPEGEEAEDGAAEEPPQADSPAETQADASADAWAGRHAHPQPDAEIHSQDDAQVISVSGAVGPLQPLGERWQQPKRSRAPGALGALPPKAQEPQVVDGRHRALRCLVWHPPSSVAASRC